MNKGFSLLEIILSMAVLSLFLSGVVTLYWSGVSSQEKGSVQREVTHQGKFVYQRLAYEIRNAQSIRSVSSSSLCLQSATVARNPTRIYLSGGAIRIAWGGGSSDCTAMSNDAALTGGLVTASSLTFTNTSGGTDSLNIAYEYTLTASGTRQEWQEAQTYAGTAEIRSN